MASERKRIALEVTPDRGGDTRRARGADRVQRARDEHDVVWFGGGEGRPEREADVRDHLGAAAEGADVLGERGGREGPRGVGRAADDLRRVLGVQDLEELDGVAPVQRADDQAEVTGHDEALGEGLHDGLRPIGVVRAVEDEQRISLHDLEPTRVA